ncbi:hypothetical protein TB2_013264 [Malus domestica]
MLIRGPSQECMLLRALRRECTLPKRSARGWSSGCSPERCWKGLSALVLLRDISFGARQLYDLSRQVLFAIWIGRASKECASLGSGRVVDSEREI